MSNNKSIILIDGSSYLYRAYHAMPELSNSNGQPTGAIYGVVNMIKRLINDYQPVYMAAVFDAKGKNFRHQMYDQYKANRPPMPEDLRQQINTLYHLIEALGVPLLSVSGVEADDVIGTLAKAAEKQNFDVVISSGDKDLTQLVSDQVVMVDTMKDAVYDRAGVEAKFGVTPERIIDYLALVGDTSDNVPGVPKVGPKTAVKWMQAYGDLDDIVDNAQSIKGKVGENLRHSLAQLELSKQLVTIKLDVALEQAVEDLKIQSADNQRLRELYTELEFRNWLGDLDDGAGASIDAAVEKTEANYSAVTDPETLELWIERLKKAELFAFDTETTSIRAEEAELVGLSLAIEAGEAIYIPVAHDYENAPKQLSRDEVLERLRPLLEDPDIVIVGQNIKYDYSVLANYGIELQGIRFDTMLESYVLNSTASRHDMDTLALRHLNHQTIKYRDVAGTGKNQLHFNQVPLEQAIPYAAEDASITLRLHQALWPELQKFERQREVFENIEMPLVPVLSRIERYGVRIDSQMLLEMSADLATRADAIELEAHGVAGVNFNLASPKQIQEVLYERMQLPVLRKTPKGQPSTAENVLQELALDYELPQLILAHRSLSKLRSTYTEKLPKMVNARTGRVHTSYHQAVAATGRLSSIDPNLQNIPVRSADGRKIREAFIPAEGYRLLSVDYSQIELRIMAHLSADPGLMRAFSEGADIHRATAAEIFDIPLATVSTDQRRYAKAVNFGLIYGMSAFGLAQQLKIDRAQAQKYVDSYFARYTGVKNYMDTIRQQAHETGYVETLFGRRLYLPEINAKNHARRQYAERTAINAPMQGTAADLIKKAMLAVDQWLRKDQVQANIIMQVHDELVLEVEASIVEEVSAAVQAQMVGVAELNVPLIVDAGIGDNWGEAH